jgi:DNA-binding XRE family transcriptional regulator
MSVIWFDAPMREMPPWFAFEGETFDRRCACETLGAWAAAARRELRCSQADFGALVGLHQSTISRLERGQLRYLRFATAVQLLVLIIQTFLGPRPPAVLRSIA